MEIHQRGQAYSEKDGCLEFDFTKLILRSEIQEYFYAITKDRIGQHSTVDLSRLELTPIPIEEICPRFSEHFTEAPKSSTFELYIKKANLLDYGDSPASDRISDQVLHEVKICEILRANPHSNMAAYMGCVVTAGRIRGLCFKKYLMTLAERKRAKKPLDTAAFLQGINSGIRHLHALGLVHNDINPTNIMFDEDDHPIIIDFDTCYYHNQKLGPKAGTFGWSEGSQEVARYENDLSGVSRLQEYIEQ